MTAEEEATATNLVTIAQVLGQRGGDTMLDPQYNWTPAAVAEMLVDLNEPVYKFRGEFLIDTTVAGKLEAFLEDFLVDG